MKLKKRKSQVNKDPKILVTIAMFYVAVALTCDPLAYKIIDLKFTPIIGASILFPMLYVFVDIIAELYGQSLARFIVYVHIICDLFFTFVIISIIHLPSPDWWHLQSAYNQVLDPMGRLYIAGVIGTLCSFLTNIYLLVRWKKIYGGKYFWARSFFATAIGIIIYTVVTDLIAFSHIRDNISITLANTSTNILFAALYMLIAVPIVRYFKHLFKDEEKIAPFNPFND